MELDEEDWLNLDTSQYDFPNTLWHIKPPGEMAIKATAMVIIGSIGIFFNTIIVTIIVRNKWLWNASNYFIGNMALVDLAMLVFCPWFMLVRDFYQNFVLENFGCQFEGFMQASLLLASVAAVMLVSYDRLASAALTSDAKVSKSTAPKLIIISWFLAMALSLPWIIKREYTERQWKNHLEKFCVEDVKVLGIYWHFTLSLLVWVPLGLMAITVEGSYDAMWFSANYLMYANSAINPLIYGFTNSRFRKAMDRTPGVRIFKFGTWCCVFTVFRRRQLLPPDKNTEKIFVIENSPKPNKKLTHVIKNILHINKETLDFSVKADDVTAKPTKITPMRTDQV